MSTQEEKELELTHHRHAFVSIMAIVASVAEGESPKMAMLAIMDQIKEWRNAVGPMLDKEFL